MGLAATVVSEYKDLLNRTEVLVREYHPVLSAGTVIGTVIRYRAELLRSGVRRGLAGATEGMARAELGSRTDVRIDGAEGGSRVPRRERPRR